MDLIHVLALIGVAALSFSWVLALRALRIAREEIARLRVLIRETVPRR